MTIRNFMVKLPVILGILLMVAATASAQEVRYNYVAGTNFANYKTYKWVDVPNHKYPSQIVDTQIKQAIDKQLVLKGLKGIIEGTPDIFVTYQLAVDRQTEWNAYGGGWRVGPRTATSSTINIGTLVVDLYDAAANVFKLNTKDKLFPPSSVGTAVAFTNNGTRGLALGGKLYFAEKKTRLRLPSEKGVQITNSTGSAA